MKEIVLITGGVKSGKSSWALEYAEKDTAARAFIATATARDEDMAARIRAHQAERAQRWTTIEEPGAIAGLIETAAADYDVVLVDCLTLWVSNLLTLEELPRDEILQRCAELAGVLERVRGRVLLVTNEVAMGIMPADALSRRYQELLGRLNSDIGRIADSVYLMVCGIPQKIK
ncbi:bifunctional adenosylcobinamide kinase/adenosylcobinamide-phosphate guanylyltransferase [Thermodesulfobacteriota bacterium]